MAQPSHISIGRLGEDICAWYLQKHGMRIVARNYRKKCGEIDIVAEKDGVLHFVEVKSGSCNHPWPVDGSDTYSPLDHMHQAKRDRLARVIEVYLGSVAHPGAWTCDVAEVLIDRASKRARVRLLHDITL